MRRRFFFLRSLLLWTVGLFVLLAPGAARADLEVYGEHLGYSPDCPITFARLQIRNRTGDKVRCNATFFANHGNGSSEVKTGPWELEPDAEQTVDVPLPLIPYASVRVEAPGRRIMTSLNRPNHSGVIFLNVAEPEKQASEKEMDDFSGNYQVSSHMGTYGGHRGSTGAGNRIVTQLAPDRLPVNWMCYAPYRGVMVRESAYDRLPAGARAALMRWVDAGGSLLVYGAEKNEVIRQMNGRIRFQSRSPFTFEPSEYPEEWRRVTPAWQANNQWQHATGTSAEDRNFPFRLREMSGRAGAFGLATVFLVLAGPVNYFYFRRRDQIRKLMISLPAISVGFCVLILGYFVATQGFTKQGGSFALTLLDESRGEAMTFARHSVFSGLYPLGGFRFDREAAFVPLRKAQNFKINLGATAHLQSGIFQPTANFHYQTALPHTTREKLIYRSGETTVVNGFEKPAELVVLRDGDRWYYAGGIAPGAKAKLEPVPQEPLRLAYGEGAGRLLNLMAALSGRWSDPEKNFLIGPMSSFASAPLPEGVQYAVSFSEGDEKTMQPGLKLDKAGSRHVLISVANESRSDFSPPPLPVQTGGGTDVPI